MNLLTSKKINQWLAAIFVGLMAIALFQNCKNTNRLQTDTTDSNLALDEKIENSEKNIYQSLVYESSDPLSANQTNVSATRLEIDLVSLSTTFSYFDNYPIFDETSHLKKREKCQLDSARATSLKQILHQVSICRPAPLKSGEVVCMAMAVSDITLRTSNENIQLSAVICNSGTYLCGEKDGQLRALLIDIKNKKPKCE